MQTVPGIQERSAASILAETGADMQQFHPAKHLSSWAGVCPGNNRSAGRNKSSRTARVGIPWLQERAHRMRVGSSGHQELFSQGQVLEPDQPVGWSQGSRSGRRRARHVDPHLSGVASNNKSRSRAGRRRCPGNRRGNVCRCCHHLRRLGKLGLSVRCAPATTPLKLAPSADSQPIENT